MSNALSLSLTLYCLQDKRCSSAHARHFNVINIIHFGCRWRSRWPTTLAANGAKAKRYVSRMHFAHHVCSWVCVWECVRCALPLARVFVGINILSTHLNYGKPMHDGYPLSTLCATYSLHQPAKTEFPTATPYIFVRLKWRLKSCCTQTPGRKIAAHPLQRLSRKQGEPGQKITPPPHIQL